MSEQHEFLTCGEAAHRLRYHGSVSFRRWANKAGFPLVRVSQTKLLVRREDLELEVERRTRMKAAWLASLRNMGLTREGIESRVAEE